jgi:glycosyltransferase involved in cell wall biosynthesis
MLPSIGRNLMSLLHRPGYNVSKAAMTLAAFPRRVIEALSTRSYNAVLIHRAITIAGPAFLERIVHRLGRPVIFDFDDAIYLLHTTNANRRLGWLKFPRRTELLCRISNHVVAGNSYLAGYARRYNDSVTVIPTSVDIDRYRPAQPRSEGPVIIGWTGSSTSQAHLEMFAPVLAALASRPDIEIRVLSDKKPSLPGIGFTWRPWSAKSEVKEMAAFHIGIMPMPDNEWSRGKCSLKALLYMAMGIPAVCSPVGANREIITHRENGLLPRSLDEWVASIYELADDPALRSRIGASARRTVEQRFSAAHSADLLARVIRDAVQGRSGHQQQPPRNLKLQPQSDRGNDISEHCFL